MNFRMASAVGTRHNKLTAGKRRCWADIVMAGNCLGYTGVIMAGGGY